MAGEGVPRLPSLLIVSACFPCYLDGKMWPMAIYLVSWLWLVSHAGVSGLKSKQGEGSIRDKGEISESQKEE